MIIDFERSKEKVKQIKQLSMFSKSIYTHGRVGDVIWIEDMGGPKTVTNDMDNVLIQLHELYADILKCKIIYKDSYGEWDRVILRSIGISVDFTFVPITPGRIIKSMKDAISGVENSL